MVRFADHAVPLGKSMFKFADHALLHDQTNGSFCWKRGSHKETSARSFPIVPEQSRIGPDAFLLPKLNPEFSLSVARAIALSKPAAALISFALSLLIQFFAEYLHQSFKCVQKLFPKNKESELIRISFNFANT